jgi:hypothetical protein
MHFDFHLQVMIFGQAQSIKPFSPHKSAFLRFHYRILIFMKCDTWVAPQKCDNNMYIWNVRNHSPSDTTWRDRNCQLLQSENLKACTATAAATTTIANGFKLCLELMTS